MATLGANDAQAVAQAYSPRALTEGERWTAQALSDLRVGAYRPRAWMRFVASSLERSAQARVEHPALAAQGRRWGLGGALCWTAACSLARGREGASMSWAPGLVWWAAVWQMLDWHVGMAEGGDGHPRERLSPADAVTLSRFWLVPVVVGLRHSEIGLPAVIVLGGLTDWADGAVAREHGRTRLGRDLDTTADLAFFGTAAAAASAAQRLSPAGTWALLLRYGVGVALSMAAVFGRARRPAIRARPWGATLRVAGMALDASGSRRVGTAVLMVGCAIPPRSTAPELSRA